MTQYGMKALFPRRAQPLWTEEGRYQGVAAEAVLLHLGDGEFEVEDSGDATRYDTHVLEFKRSRDLFIKRALNHRSHLSLGIP